MSYLFQLSSRSVTILSRASRLIPGSSLSPPPLWWKTNVSYYGVRRFGNLEYVLSRFYVQCYSSRSRTPTRKKGPNLPELEEEKDAFFVVRKGDVVGVYKTLKECQAQVSSSLCDPPVSVYKGNSLPKDATEYLASKGLQDALYTIKAADLKEELFGSLTPCPFQALSGWGRSRSPTRTTPIQIKPYENKPDIFPFEPLFLKGEFPTSSVQERPDEALDSENVYFLDLCISSNEIGRQTLTPFLYNTQRGLIDGFSLMFVWTFLLMISCVLEFDGASKGNPGKAGAGAVLRADDGSLICKLRQGLGTATCNAAEYRAIILGLKHASDKGYTHIRVKGDSKLVCMQLQGLWKVKNKNMSELSAEVKKLKKKFRSFQINHVLREFNKDADAEANLAVSLGEGQVEEDLLQ